MSNQAGSGVSVEVVLEEAAKKRNDPLAAIEVLLPAEKQTRMAGEFEANSKVTCAIVEVCLASGNWVLLGEQVSALVKKRGLIKQSMSHMFQKCLEHVSVLPDRDSKEALLRCVRQHTEGKVYVEIERARATRLLAVMNESEGRLKDAFELMLEVAVETFGSMPRHEKYDFILEQMRLALATDQYSQAQIISRKINPKVFIDNVDDDFQRLKVKYSELMVRLSLHSKKYLECAKACRVILGSPFVDSDLTFTQTILFALLASYNKEQHELVHQLVQDKRIKSLPVLADLLRTFLRRELISWPAIESVVQSSNVFDMELFAKAGWMSELQRRVVEHNVRIVSELYGRITLQRMSELLNLDIETAESTLADLINARTITAKIDRFDGIVTFVKSRAGGASDTEHALLNQWSSQIDALLALMVKTNHMISKEETTQSIKQQQSV